MEKIIRTFRSRRVISLTIKALKRERQRIERDAMSTGPTIILGSKRQAELIRENSR